MKDSRAQELTDLKKRNLPWYRHWLAKIWLTHGGGLYAVGYASTFLYLEVRTIIGELLEAEGVIDFLTDQVFDFFIRFAIDSIANMIHAFIWFLPVISFKPPVGIIALGIGFYIFDIFLRERVANWLLRAPKDRP